MSIYTTLYAKFSNLQADLPESPRFIYPVDLPFLKLEKQLRDCVIGVPAIYEDTKLYFGNMVLKNDEFGRYAACRLMMASTCMLSAKASFLWLLHKPISRWIAEMDDILRAQFVANVVADTVARKRIADIEGRQFYKNVIVPADMICVSMLSKTPASLPEFSQATLTKAILGFTPAYVPSTLSSTIEEFLTELRTITMGARCKQSLLGDLYCITTRIPGPWHSVYLPYANRLPEARVETRIFSDSPDEQVFESIREQGGLGPVRYGEDALGHNLFFEISREAKRMKMVLAKLARTAVRSNLSSFGFPPSDLACYRQLYDEMAPQVRRAVEQARLVKNVLDESMFEQVGNVDLQVAIQSIASETFRSDTFVRDDDILKNESWGVLIDTSLSLEGIGTKLKSVALCVAEIAKEVIGLNPWGMFAFSDEFYCIKDFSEPYDGLSKARIGGLSPGGLSHIPDAIRTCKQMLLEHARERNYIIIVSDGLPTGYPGIENELVKAIKETRASGVALAAIGVGTNRIRQYIPNAKTIKEPGELAKTFSEIYFSLSS